MGGIPVVLIAGDDYQLQGMGECAPDTLPQFVSPTSDKNILNGRNLFKEFRSIVYKLPKVRRMDGSKVRDMQLLDRVRVGENVPDDDVQRLQGLHIDVIERKHGKAVVAAIKRNAIYLFFKNVKRSEHNLLHLSQLNTEDNPTAILKTKSSSSKHVKGVRGHFKNKSAPSSLLCILGAKFVSETGTSFLCADYTMGLVGQCMKLSLKNPNPKAQLMEICRAVSLLSFLCTGVLHGTLTTLSMCPFQCAQVLANANAVKEPTVRWIFVSLAQFTNFRDWKLVRLLMMVLKSTCITLSLLTLMKRTLKALTLVSFTLLFQKEPLLGIQMV